MLALIIVAIAVVVLAAAYCAAMLLLARAVVFPQRARPAKIFHVSPSGDVELTSNPLTRFGGIIGLLYDDETKLAVLTSAVDEEDADGTVVRHLAEPAALEAGTDGRAAGNVFTPTNVTTTPPASVEIHTDHASQPAWLYAGTGAASSTWVIHVHGMLAGRDSALRSVQAVAGAGYTSLVISYRGDREAAGETREPSALGQAEWQDLDAAIAYARSQGAARIVVVGWSLGATVALEETTRGLQGASIDALVLVSPVVSWARTIHYGMARQHVPRWLASSAIALLSSRLGARVLGLPLTLSLTEALPTVSIPTLVIHSTGDLTTPFAASEAFAASSDRVVLEQFPASPHAMEWNAAPKLFAAHVDDWIVANLRQSDAEDVK
ncbi:MULTISPECIES: alpha/beta hydrolase family protein [unclassified Curtobacterium]|uniref:alpha/beta hydrolase family protein n=1 Tax=unclassified Curtobacterium TaxID=257496 RepID=UPI00188BCD90|nr:MULTISPECIES: alpha/beta fold hydrolase [unclassified Curtobacterium]MBF4591694.1 alpha/beta fold hydrolase [Curtobacterium sp. VKM Ac-1395]MCY1692978.1 prolyl oligopeptidase family serine peptidase [Curtobacterium sp. SL109]